MVTTEYISEDDSLVVKKMSQEEIKGCFVVMQEMSTEDGKRCFVANFGDNFFDENNGNVTDCSCTVASLFANRNLLGYPLETLLASLCVRLKCVMLKHLLSNLDKRTNGTEQKRAIIIEFLVYKIVESLSERVCAVLFLCSLRDCRSAPKSLLVDTLANCNGRGRPLTRQEVEDDIAYAVDLKLVSRDHNAIVLKHNLSNADYSESVEVISMHPWMQSLLGQDLSHSFVVRIAHNFCRALVEHFNSNNIPVSHCALLTALGVAFCNLLLLDNIQLHMFEEESVDEVKQLIKCLENFSWPKRFHSKVTRVLKG